MIYAILASNIGGYPNGFALYGRYRDKNKTDTLVKTEL
jgi:hypothetical protein